MGTAIARKFVGWDRPMLESVRDYLLAELPASSPGAPGDLDLSGFTVVLPGARAGRRLLELLVQHAEANEGAGGGGRAQGLLPPRILTVGAMVAEHVPLPVPPAGPVARALAWSHALRRIPAETASRIALGFVATAGIEVLSGLSAILDSCHTELAGECLGFADVAERASRGENGAGFIDHGRWLAAAAVQESYLRVLAEVGLCDEHSARSRAGPLAESTSDHPRHVVLAGIADLNTSQRRLIDALPGRVSALIFAPPSVADRFDSFGCVTPSAWTSVEIALPPACLRIVNTPADQAEAALEALAASPGIAPDQATIGVPDPDVAPHIERLAARLGVPVRLASGLPGGVARSGPLRFLVAIADLVEGEGRGSSPAFAALVRHPDAERWLISRRLSPEAVERWLTLLDEYQGEHLSGSVPETWLGDDEGRRDMLTRLTGAIDELLGALRRSPRPLREWAGHILSVLRAVYADLPAGDPHEQRVLAESCAAIRDVLVELAALDPRLDSSPVPAAAALRLVAAQAAQQPVPAAADQPAIELLGWLELSLDDAPALAITGMNEGRVPTSVSADPLLPDRLRAVLGITDNQRRYARDAFALSAIAASRPAPGLALIAGRFSAAADPLAPSRLLFACDDAQLAARVRMWTEVGGGGGGDKPARPAAPPGVPVGERSAFRPFPSPAPVVEPIERISVTAFRNYLASPYGFYLQNVLRLKELDDGAVELDALGFGVLLHDVLSTLTDADIARSTDPELIERFLFANLEALARLRFSEEPIPAVWVQLQQARARIRAFAGWQAARAAEGWQVHHTEWAPPPSGETPWIVDGKPILLRGRIDRIDHNEREKRWRILDYKTGDKPPRVADTRARDGTWIDLQLPLYLHLVSPLKLAGPIELGYVVIPKKAGELGLDAAKWDGAALASADEAAREVVRAVREGRFSLPGDGPLTRGILGVICGEGLLATEPDEDERALLEEEGP